MLFEFVISLKFHSILQVYIYKYDVILTIFKHGDLSVRIPLFRNECTAFW